MDEKKILIPRIKTLKDFQQDSTLGFCGKNKYKTTTFYNNLILCDEEQNTKNNQNSHSLFVVDTLDSKILATFYNHPFVDERAITKLKQSKWNNIIVNKISLNLIRREYNGK